MGIVYLIHLDRKMKHAQHYLGYVHNNVEKRFNQHYTKKGAKILKAAREQKIGFSIVRVWEGVDRTFERRLKNRKKARCICPACCYPKKIPSYTKSTSTNTLNVVF